MAISDALTARAMGTCELCGAVDALSAFDVSHGPGGDDGAVAVCATCHAQIEDPAAMDPQHWRTLSDSMWTPVPAVQALAWRMLDRLRTETWAQDLAEMLYLDDDTRAWAEAGAEAAGPTILHIDSNGVQLAAGDTVTLIKDLTVKGAGFTAKRGTAVRGIALDHDNAKHIEGRVNGQRIVILCAFVKKTV
ncbi:MAG: protein PhnA [Paracoccaceae bacterium]|jgi:protein PhnA